MDVGDQVEVYSSFSNSWVRGYEVAEIIREGYRVRRRSDASLLPGFSSEADLRFLPSRDRPNS